MFPDGLFCFCCGSLYDSPFSFLFLALSGASSDEEEEEDDDGGDDDEGGGGGDEFSCVQFGSRYQRNGVLPLHVPSTEELTLTSPKQRCALNPYMMGVR